MFGGNISPTNLFSLETSRLFLTSDIFPDSNFERLGKSKKDFLIYSHREGVTKCPDDFEIAATSNMVNIEGLVHKTLPIWTFQPHIEASKTFSRRIGLSADEFNKCDFFGKQLLKSFFNKLK